MLPLRPVSENAHPSGSAQRTAPGETPGGIPETSDPTPVPHHSRGDDHPVGAAEPTLTDQEFDNGSLPQGEGIIGAEVLPPAGVAGPVPPTPIGGVRSWPPGKGFCGFRGLGNGEGGPVGADGDPGI